MNLILPVFTNFLWITVLVFVINSHTHTFAQKGNLSVFIMVQFCVNNRWYGMSHIQESFIIWWAQGTLPIKVCYWYQLQGLIFTDCTHTILTNLLVSYIISRTTALDVYGYKVLFITLFWWLYMSYVCKFKVCSIMMIKYIKLQSWEWKQNAQHMDKWTFVC